MPKEFSIDMDEEWRNNGRIPEYGSKELEFLPEDIVKSCSKIESGVRLGDDGIRACCMGAIVSPMYWSAAEAANLCLTKEMLVEKRKQLFKALNDPNSGNISCKGCHFVEKKEFKDVKFTGLGHVNLAHFSMCNLRCDYCGFTQHDRFFWAQYNALPILELFQAADVEWDSFVDLNGGEPTLLKDLSTYIQTFKRLGVRILLYTNAVRFSQAVYDAVADGTISWLITSLDAGVPSSFKRMKGRDEFSRVMENLTRYAHAGSKGGGNLAVKYIFTKDNCGDDDISGFVYAMLAIRPQKVWLQFDFFPLADKYEGQTEVGKYDYSEHVKAYVKMFLMFKRFGVEPAHFSKTHLAAVVQTGKDLISEVETRIAEELRKIKCGDESLQLTDFRKPVEDHSRDAVSLALDPLRICLPDGSTEAISLDKRRILFAPAYSLTKALLGKAEFLGADVLGFLDKNTMLHSRHINGLRIYPYERIVDLKPDMVVVASPEQHRRDIISTISKLLDSSSRIGILT